MQICGVSCMIAAISIFSMIYMTVGPYYTSPGFMQGYEATLDEKQREIYKKIVKERATIYMQGYALGIALALLLVFFNKQLGLSKKIGKSPTLCLIVAVAAITNYFYYILSPKSNWMVTHLETKEQKAAWLNVYRTMQWNYHFSYALGIVGVFFLTRGCSK